MSNNKNILIADDHIMVRNGIRQMLACQDKINFEICEASNGAEVIDMVSKKEYDIVIMDIQMPKIDGISATRKIREFNTKVPIIAVVELLGKKKIKQAMQCGVNGIVSKSTGCEELLRAIDTVWNDESYYCNEVTQVILGIYKEREKVQVVNEILTNREREVLSMLAQELTNDQIADQLGISKRTVEGHRKNLKSKLRVKSTIGLVRYAYEMSLVS